MVKMLPHLIYLSSLKTKCRRLLSLLNNKKEEPKDIPYK
jgi:hypothetical protein